MMNDQGSKQTRADDIAALLNARYGDGWVGAVWENLGWHAKAVNETAGIAVHDNVSGKYTAYAQPFSKYVGKGIGPHDAVEDLLLQYRRAARDAQAIVNRLDRVRNVFCFVCRKPIVGDDLLDCHDNHEENCPNSERHLEGRIVDCDCDLHSHPWCCPDCNQGVSE